MDCPSHHPNPTSGGTCRDPTLVAVDYCQNIRSIFLSYRAETPRENTLQCHSLTTERSHPGSAWMVCVCVCICVKHDGDICPAFNQRSPTLKPVQHRCTFYRQECSVGWSGGLLWLAAEWGVSCSWEENDQTRIGPTVGWFSGKPLHRLFKKMSKLIWIMFHW